VFAVQTARSGALRLLRQPGRTFFWVALNVRMRPFDDPRVREALSLATDRAALVFALLGGFGSPAETPLAASTPYALPPADRLAYDPNRARRLLQAAGWGRGLRIALAAQDSDESIVEALQAMWAKVGVTVEIRRLEGGVYAAAAYAPPQQKAVEGLGGVVASWSSGLVPELQLRPLFARSSAAPAGANLGFFADPRVDRLLDEAESTAEPARRKDLYAAVQTLILCAEPAVLLYTRDDLVGLSRGVRGVRVSPDGALDVLFAVKT
jgi:glutathione transport system substrate-binding protein